MDSILASSSVQDIVNPMNMSDSSTSDSGFNKITIMLIIFLILACCLLCIGYDFNFSKMFSSGTGLCACFILFCFMFYIFWNHFWGAGSGNTKPMISQETKNKYMGQFKNSLSSFGNATYNASQGITNPTLNRFSNSINQYGQRIITQPVPTQMITQQVPSQMLGQQVPTQQPLYV